MTSHTLENTDVDPAARHVAGDSTGVGIADPSHPAALHWPESATGEKPTERSEQAIRFFFETGIRRPDDDPGPASSSFHPAVLHPYLSDTGYRQPWPLVVEVISDRLKARGLSDVVDETIERLDAEGDVLEIRKRALLQLEKGLREAASAGAPRSLRSALEEVGAVVLHSVNGKKDRHDEFEAALGALSAGVGPGARLLPFGRASAAEILSLALEASVDSGRSSLLAELDFLDAKLEDLLRVEAEDSVEGANPEHLERTVGGSFRDELNFGSLSHLMEAAPHGSAIPPDRRERIVAVRGVLALGRSLMFARHDRSAAVPLSDLAVALETVEENRAAFTELVRCLMIARLEVENHYSAERHDPIFNDFSEDAIDPSLLRVRPPVALVLGASELESNRSVFEDLIESRWPVACLIHVDDLIDARCRPTRAARAALALVPGARTCVAGCSLAAATHFVEAVQTIADSPGAGVVFVYAPSSPARRDLSPYLDAALAGDARLFPSFAYAPARGFDWASRFSGAGNEQQERSWPETVLSVGDEELRVRATATDYLACDPRFTGDFLPLTSGEWRDDLIPIEDWIEADEAERRRRLPYTILADDEGRLFRAVVSRRAVESTTTFLDGWRLIQEWSGIQSSLVERRAGELREELKRTHEKEIEDLRTSFHEMLQTATAAVARQVVENIASGLLGVGGSGALPAVALRPARTATGTDPGLERLPGVDSDSASVAPAAQEAPSAPVAGEEDDDDSLSMDEAYIDTPLCTSCNECTDMNGIMFAYNENKQAYIRDATAGTYRELVMAAEKCPARIIHPGKPLDLDEPNLEEWVERAARFR